MRSVGELFVLGTVQLGMPYGRRSGRGRMATEEARAILDAAWAEGIRVFDVAEAYGGSCAILADWLRMRRRFGEVEIVTKVSVGPEGIAPGQVEAAITPFSECVRLTVLSHHAVDDIGWTRLREVAYGAGALTGQSVYSPDEVAAALDKPGMARIQAPSNVFDRGALLARGAAPVPLDLRSAYLQGVLLDPPEIAERRAPGAGALARAVNEAARAVDHSSASLLLATALNAARPGDRMVFGVDAPGELVALSEAQALSADVVRQFEAAMQEIARGRIAAATLDPRTWPRHD